MPIPVLRTVWTLKPTLGWTSGEAASGRARHTYPNDGEFEHSLGWTHTVGQDGRKWQGPRRPRANLTTLLLLWASIRLARIAARRLGM